MNRTSGTGLLAFGAIMAVVGAILKYTVTLTNSHGFDVNTVGLILLIAGIVIFLSGIAVLATATKR